MSIQPLYYLQRNLFTPFLLSTLAHYTLATPDCLTSQAYCEQAELYGLADVLGYGRGAAFVDINNDGYDDLFVVDTDNRFRSSDYGISTFYINNGQGRFQRHNLGLSEKDTDSNWSAAFADYDNDGDQDLILTNGGYTGASTIAIYENQISSKGRLINRTDQLGLENFNTQKSSWWGASWADFDDDGYLDVVVTRRNGSPLLLHNQHGQKFIDVAVQHGIQRPSNSDKNRDNCDWKNPVWFDYDNDGDEDLYLAGIQCHAFFLNEEGKFIDQTQKILDQLPIENPHVFAAAAADFNQDGYEDLYLGRWYKQDMVLYGNKDGQPELKGPSIGLNMSNTRAPYENTMGLGIGDIYDDGFPDIIIGSGDPATRAADLAFCNHAGKQFKRCSEEFYFNHPPHKMTRGHGAVFSDIDRDGDTDWFFNLGGHPKFDQEQNQDSREINKLFINQNPLKVKTSRITLEGRRSNRDAIGAKLILHTNTKHYYKISSSQGFQSQNSKALLVSLGQQQSSKLEIHWPSGTISTHKINAGKSYHFIEPAQ